MEYCVIGGGAPGDEASAKSYQTDRCFNSLCMHPMKIIITLRTCGNSTACDCYLNCKPVDPPPPPPPKQTGGPVGKAGLELLTP